MRVVCTGQGSHRLATMGRVTARRDEVEDLRRSQVATPYDDLRLTCTVPAERVMQRKDDGTEVTQRLVRRFHCGLCGRDMPIRIERFGWYVTALFLARERQVDVSYLDRVRLL